MPRYFLHVVNDTSETADEEGGDYADLDGACREARRTIGAILVEEIAQGKDSIHLTVMIDDERGRVANIKSVTSIATTTRPFTD